MDYYKVLMTTSMSFVILLALTRLLGKKQLSQLTFFNYITGITIGSIAANIVTLEGKEFWKEIFGLFLWCLFTYLVDLIALKLPFTRSVLGGQPTILIKKGSIEYDCLKKMRIDIDHLNMMLREQGIFSSLEVEYAILEPNGELTVLKKSAAQTPNKKDLSVQLDKIKYLPQEIIVDGKVRNKNLNETGLTMEWLMNELKKKGIKDIKDVLYAQLQDDGSLFIDV